MNKLITTTVAFAACAAGSIGIAGWSTAGAAADPAAGEQVLDLLCAESGGTSYFTPYAIARCQNARSNTGLEIEVLVCEGLLEGTFAAAPSPTRPGHTTWSCFPGPA
jgi:hypothetical protein